MTQSDPIAERRLQRLQRVLAARRRRLEATLERRSLHIAGQAPRGTLQRYGYPVAALLAAIAVLPTAVGFALKHRRVLARAATTADEAQKWSRLLEDVRPLANER